MSEFLGPHGKATVVLMNAHFETELPKLKDLKKILHIPDGRYYKSSGRNYHEVNKIHRLLNVLAELRGEDANKYKNHSSDYLITVAEVHSNLFMALKYSAQIVDGFNLTDQCISELDKLLERYRSICSMQDDIKYMWRTLEDNKEIAEKHSATDKTILNPDIPALKVILHGYGDSHYAQVAQEIRDWYETYKWKVKAPSQKSDSDIDENSETEVTQ
jgi:hypothetical protein